MNRKEYLCGCYPDGGASPEGAREHYPGISSSHALTFMMLQAVKAIRDKRKAR
jgi:hypothetical protein